MVIIDVYIWKKEIQKPSGIIPWKSYPIDEANIYGIENFITLREYVKNTHNISIGTMVYYLDEIRKVESFIIMVGSGDIIVTLENTKIGERIYKPIDELIPIYKIRNNRINEILE